MLRRLNLTIILVFLILANTTKYAGYTKTLQGGVVQTAKPVNAFVQLLRINVADGSEEFGLMDPGYADPPVPVGNGPSVVSSCLSADSSPSNFSRSSIESYWQETEQRERHRSETHSENSSSASNKKSSSFSWRSFGASFRSGLGSSVRSGIGYGIGYGLKEAGIPIVPIPILPIGLKFHKTSRSEHSHRHKNRTVRIDSMDSENIDRQLSQNTTVVAPEQPIQAPRPVEIEQVSSNLQIPEPAPDPTPIQASPKQVVLISEQWQERVCSAVYACFSKAENLPGHAVALVVLSANRQISCTIIENDQHLSVTEQANFDRVVEKAIDGLENYPTLLSSPEVQAHHQIALVFGLEKQAGGRIGWDSHSQP